MTPEERRKTMEERLASITPEQRAQWEERMCQRGAGGQGGPGGGPGGQGGGQQGFARNDQGGGRGGGNQAGGGQMASRDLNRGIRGGVTPGSSITSGATTIDSLFGPLPSTESRGRVWIFENKQLRSVPVRMGVSDATFSELLDGDVKEGQELVVNMVTGLEPVNRPGQTGTGNPLMGPQRGGPGGGGGGRGPGGGGRGF